MSALHEDLEIEVLALSGKVVATVKLPQDASVAELKKKIADSSGIPASMQNLSLPSRQFGDGERLGSLSSETEFSVVLIIADAPPIDFELGGKAYQITSVQVKWEDQLLDVPLAACANAILQRQLPTMEFANPLSDSHILFWDAIPVDGRELIREKLVEILKVKKTEGATAVALHGSVVQLHLQPNPSLLPRTSILFGLSSGQFFGTHAVGQCAYGTWGWIRLAESDSICGLRVMSHPTCGNTTPSGMFMMEYLGTVGARTRIEEHGAVHRKIARMLAVRHNLQEAQEEVLGITCEVLHLSRGRMAKHQHAPLEALEVSLAPDFDLILVKAKDTEMIMFPWAGVYPEHNGGQAASAFPAFEMVMPGETFVEVSTCAHLNRAPQRYNPTWIQRRLRQLMFGA